MKTLHTVQNKNTFEIYTENELYASIIFENHAEAILKIGDKTFHIVEGETKNMVLKANNETLFVFEFDKLWGGAKLVSDGTDLGLDIKGRLLKSGTRLIDSNDNDLVVVKNKENNFEVTIVSESTSAMMIVATIYYHIYASREKLLAILF